MKKLALAVILSAIGIGSASAADLATGRLLFAGALNESGCTVEGATNGGGDITVAMPGSLGVSLVAPLTANTTAGWNTLNAAAKYDGVGAGFNLNITCPKPSIYSYLANLLNLTGADVPDLAKFNTNAGLFMYGAGNGASGFIDAAASGSVVGVLAADAGSANQSVGIVVWHKNARGGEKALDLAVASSASGVSVPVTWTETATDVKTVANFDFAYVPASTAGGVHGGVTTATLPFRFEYR